MLLRREKKEGGEGDVTVKVEDDHRRGWSRGAWRRQQRWRADLDEVCLSSSRKGSLKNLARG